MTELEDIFAACLDACARYGAAREEYERERALAVN
jgi:hypothetical protein